MTTSRSFFSDYISLLILIFGIVSNAGASVLVKVAVTPPRALHTMTRPMDFLTNWPLLFGVVLYGVAFLLYSLALTRLPLHVAHPILTAGAIAAVALCAAFVFHEPLRASAIVGIILICCGIVSISYGTIKP